MPSLERSTKRTSPARRSIGSYLLWRTALLALVPMTLAFTVGVVLAFGSITKRAESELDYVANRLAASLGTALDSFRSTLQIAASHADAGVFSGDDLDAARTYFTAILEATPEMDGLWLLDGETGTVLTAAPEHADVQGLDLSRQDSFTMSQRGTARWSSIGMSPVSAGTSIALSIRSDAFVIVAWFRPTELVSLVQLDPGGAEMGAFATDVEGTLIAHPEFDRVERRENVRDNPLVRRALNGRSASGVHDGMLMSVRPILGQGWVVGVATERALVTRVTSLLVVLGVASFVVSVVLIFAASRRGARRLEATFAGVVGAAQRVGRGDYDVDLPPQRFVELETLSETIREMIDAIHEREDRLTAVVTNADVVFYALDTDGVFRLSEGKALAKLGLRPGQVVGRSAFEVYADHPDIVDGLRRSIRGEHVSIAVQVGPVAFQNYQTPIRDRAGELAGVIGVAVDITEREELSRRLRALNDQLERQVEERTAQLTATNQELSDALSDLRASQQRLVDSEKLSALGHFAAGLAHELNTPLGVIRSSSELISTITGSAVAHALRTLATVREELRDAMLGLMDRATSRPAQPRQGAEGLLRRRELAVRLRGEAIAGADAIAGFLVDMGVDDHVDEILPALADSRGHEAVSAIAEFVSLRQAAGLVSVSSSRAAEIVRALRSYIAPNSRHEWSRVDVEDELETILLIMNNKLKRGVEIVREYAGARVMGSATELNQVWMNLIRNAAEAMDYVGTLTLTTATSGDNVLVTVADTGPGVPEEIRARIFTPFFTTKARGEGLGIGLDIANQIVRRHGGRVELESRPGSTRFTVVLPSGSA